MRSNPIKDIKVFYGVAKDLNANTAAFPSATTGFDLTGFEDAIVIVQMGVMAASSTCDVTCLTSDATNGTYAAVSSATMTLVDGDDSKCFVGRINMTKANPFLRVTPTTSAHSVLGSVTVLGVNPRVAPVTQEVTTATKTFDVAG